jgi:hypothetical protein
MEGLANASRGGNLARRLDSTIDINAPAGGFKGNRLTQSPAPEDTGGDLINKEWMPLSLQSLRHSA